MNSENLKFNLLFGLPIQYENIKIYQPTIKDYMKIPIGINGYYSYKYLFCITLKNLDIGKELIDVLLKENKTLFQSLFICDELLKQKEMLNNNNSLIITLINSLMFFLKVDINCFKIDGLNEQIIIIDKNTKEKLFILNNDNFEEFSSLIRLISSCDMIEIKKEKNNIKYPKDEELRKTMEKLLRQKKETEAKKELENAITISDIITGVLAHENTKYNYFTITNLTIWQLLKEYETIYIRQGFDFEKLKLTSGNFDYSKIKPDLDWGKKIKIKIPKDITTN